MNSFLFLLAMLAVYRVARMLAEETGPFALFEKWRKFVNRKFPPDWLGKPHWMSEGFSCPFCISFWLGWPAALLLDWHTWPEYVFTALALSAGTVILHKAVG
jgi:hypothetical protein